jgi:hypothetical protein
MKIAVKFKKLIKGVTVPVNYAFLKYYQNFFKDAESDLKELCFIKK